MLKKFFFLVFPLFSAYCQIDEIAFVQLSFDGINAFNCGVGTVVLQTLEVLKELNQNEKRHFHSKLYLLTPDYSNGLKEYSHEILKKNILDCHASKGDVFLLPTKKRDVFFGDPEQWQDVCKEGAKICARIIQQNPYTVIVAHDTAFAQLPIELKSLLKKERVTQPYRVIWVPHATSWSYNGNDGKQPGWPERHEWEMKACQGAKEYGYQVGVIGEAIKNDLMNAPFSLPEEILCKYQTGIILDRFLEELPLAKISEELKKRSIPTDKQILFSIGRANPLKGQDIVLEVFRHLKPLYPDLHLVLLAPESDHTPDFIKLLKQRNAEEGLGATILDSFDSDLGHYLYQWPKTALVALFSRKDTQPLTVMEARVNPKNSLVLASNQGGMGLQVKDGEDGFVCKIDDLPYTISTPLPNSEVIQNIVKKAQQILDLPPHEKNRILQNGKRLIQQKYDLRRATLSNLDELLKDPCANLIANQKTIQQSYGLTQSLILKPLRGGMVNPPIGVWLEDETSVGVLKAELEKPEIATQRFKLMDQMKKSGFPYLPAIYKNSEGQYLTKIGNNHYSLIEYLPPDSRQNLSFEELLKLIGKFHKNSSHLSELPVHQNKWEEYQGRASIFLEYKPLLNQHILSLNDYFSSPQFKEIFQSLPKAFIHGDVNNYNILISSGFPYFIDLDSARYDVRLLDLCSLIRYGHFEDYLQCSDLFTLIEATYGGVAEPFSALEKKYFHEMVLFSHIEFLSWALTKLKESKNQNDEIRFRELVDLYIDQLGRLTKDR